MLRKIRISAAAIFFTLITLLLLDLTGALHLWFGWMAKIQLLPAILALNVAVILGLAVLTLLFGRVYCSVICPLGVFQDIVSWLSGRRRGKKNRFGYKREMKWLRYGLLVLFILLMVAGVNSVAILIAPYRAWGRIATNLIAPLYGWGNNLFAAISAHYGSYAFYPTEVYIKSLPVFIVAVVTFIVLVVLAWRGGRTWCNTVCPVGTLLGLLSRFAIFRPMIDTTQCINCGICGKRCKASCIDTKNHAIDYSRCIVCFDCLENCHSGAIKYRFAYGKESAVNEAKALSSSEHFSASETKDRSTVNEAGANAAGDVSSREHFSASETKQQSAVSPEQTTASETKQQSAVSPDESRRAFITGVAIAAGAATLEAKKKQLNAGVAALQQKTAPQRNISLVPAGSTSRKHFYQHCTACQLCISKCPNNVLKPSARLATLMQPEMQFDEGFCRIECTRCSDICPTGAIRPVGEGAKSSIQIGHAVVIQENCVAVRDNIHCGNCSRHCPTGAITMVPLEEGSKTRIPAVDPEKCIGCGSCEYHCPARPVSAI
ncbi:MAG: 4Fe-4S dicluster domain-containing protein, partial [Bacteroidales bacterium]|nr:4Fe-4S dicluster domain-containing protein [Bacteroidales bacterium]